MKDIEYRVSSIETIRTEDLPNGRSFACLSRIGEYFLEEKLLERLEIEAGSLEIGDIVRVSINSIAAETRLSKGVPVRADRSLYFLHHFDRKNQGDILSGPYNYFDFGDYKRLSWDADILNKGNIDPLPNCDVILGGGIYFTRNKPRLKRLLKKARSFIGWGIGLDARLDNDDFTDAYTLLGTRERHSKIIDDKRVFYVPCSSCMNEVFIEKPQVSTGKIALHINGGFNSKDLYENFPDNQTTTTVDDFESIFLNLRDAEFVVTNSYHGAYWGSLLQKKVLCIKTDIPKWGGLNQNIQFVAVDQVHDALKDVDPVPSAYLDECVEINRNFESLVKKSLGIVE